MKTIIFLILTTVVTVPVCAAEEARRGGGLFSEGSFLSDAISSVSDKLNRVASGEESIMNDDAKGVDKSILEPDGDPLGRPGAAAFTDKDYQEYKRLRRKADEESRVSDAGDTN